MSFFSGKKTNAQAVPAATGIPVQTSCYGKPIAIVYGRTRTGCNLIDYANFRNIPHNNPSAGAGGKGGVTGGGGKGGGGSTTNDYRADLVIALCEGPIAGVGNVWKSQTETTPAAEGFSIFDGAYPQSVFRQYPYTGIACADELQYDLGGGANLPNFNFEVVGTLAGTAPNGVDADPSRVLVDLLSNPFYGAGFAAAQIGTLLTENEPDTVPSAAPYRITVAQAASFAFNLCVAAAWAPNGAALQCVAANPASGQYAFNAGIYTFAAADAGKAITIRYAALGGLTAYQQFTLANGLWVSPAYDTQTQASQLVDDLTKYTYSSPVVSAGVLTVVPNGTVNVTGNGYSYVAPAAPLFDLGPDNFLPNKNVTGTSAAGTNDFPLIVSRGDPTAQPNDFKLQFKDRANQYAASVAEFVDQAHVDAFGRHPPASSSGDVFSDAGAANVAVRFIAEAAQVRDAYSFTLGPQWCFLDPMDVVTVSDAAQAIVEQWVRIQQMTENDDGSFSITATEYPHGTGAPAVYAINTGQGYIQNFNQDPGPVNAPVIFEPTDALAGSLEVWMAVNGGALWGGADVYVSFYGDTYQQVGTVTAPARAGTLAAALPAVTPATTGQTIDQADTLAVTLAGENNQINSGTQADASALNTACFVDGEIVAYATATLTAAGAYNLSYLVRGAYDTAIGAHAAGSQFARLDQAIFKLPFTADRIGQTLYVKFASFNIWSGGQQPLSECQAYKYTITGSALASALPNVANLTANYIAGLTQLAWTPVADFRKVDYEIRYGAQPQGAQFIGRTPNANFQLQGGDGTYWVAAHYQVASGLDVYSEQWTSIAIEGATLLQNVVATYDEAALKFDGALSGGLAVVNDTLVTTAAGNILTDPDILGTANILFYGGAVASGVYTPGRVVNKGRQAPSYVTLSFAAQGAPINQNVLADPNVLADADVLGFAATSNIAVQAQIGLSNDNVTWTWQNYVPGQYTQQYIQVQLLIASMDSNTQAIVSAFKWSVDVPDRVDVYQNVAIPAGALNLVYQPLGSAVAIPFNGGPGGAPGTPGLPAIQVGWANQAGDTLVITGQTLAGCTIQILNGGVGVARTASTIDVQGY